MDKKLNFTDLCNFYAKAVGVPVAEVESFVHAFFDVIVEGLEKDGSVKINGLGTFKVVEVESRSSVNINTGERFEIDGHKRLTFVPTDSLKDIINAPFAMFEPVEVDDDIDDDDEDDKEEVASVEEVVAEVPIEEQPVAEEKEISSPVLSVEIEEEMPCEVVEEDSRQALSVAIEEEMPIEESDYIPEQSIAVETEVAAELPEEVITEPVPNVVEEVQSAPEEVHPNEPVEESAEVVNEEPAVVEESKEKTAPVVEEKKLYFDTLPREKKSRKLPKVALIVVLVAMFIGAAFVGFYYYRDSFSFDWNKWFMAEAESVVTPVVEIPADTVAAVADSIAVDSLEVTPVDSLASVVVDSIVAQQDSVALQVSDTLLVQPVKEEKKKSSATVERLKIVESLAVRELSTIFVADTTDYKIVGTMCKHTVMSEETLIRISLNYYGDKRLWPYIVKYNNMVRPNDLACDMVLKIPRLVPRK